MASVASVCMKVLGWVYVAGFPRVLVSRTIFISCSATATTQREGTRPHGRSSSARTNIPAGTGRLWWLAGGSANWKMQSTLSTTNNNHKSIACNNYNLMACLVNYETWKRRIRGSTNTFKNRLKCGMNCLLSVGPILKLYWSYIKSYNRQLQKRAYVRIMI